MSQNSEVSSHQLIPFERLTATISILIVSINITMFYFNISITNGFIGNKLAYQVPELFTPSIILGVIFHVNLKHLLLNITLFYFLGILIEQQLGHRFLMFIILILSVSSTVSHSVIDIFVFSIPHYTVAGMSGVAYGFAGFFALYDLDSDLELVSKVFLFILLAIAIYPILTVIQDGLFNSGITNIGHLVGSLVGSIVAVIVRFSSFEK
jgi:membrane associated rhomboid family serine protease